LNLVRDVKGNKNGFCKCISRENVSLRLNEVVGLVTEDTQKAIVLSVLWLGLYWYSQPSAVPDS